jgi:L-rhamnose isomerase
MGRLAWMEAAKTAPVGAVWDYYCEREGVPRDPFWMREVQAYESAVLSRRQ